MEKQKTNTASSSPNEAAKGILSEFSKDASLFDFESHEEETTSSAEPEETQQKEETAEETPSEEKTDTDESQPEETKEDTDSKQGVEKDELEGLSKEQLIQKLKGLENIYRKHTTEVGETRKENDSLRERLAKLEGTIEGMRKPEEKSATEKDVAQQREEFIQLWNEDPFLTSTNLTKIEVTKATKPLLEKLNKQEQFIRNFLVSSAEDRLRTESNTNPEAIPYDDIRPQVMTVVRSLPVEMQEKVFANPYGALKAITEKLTNDISPLIDKLMYKKGLTKKEATEEAKKVVTKAPTNIKANGSGVNASKSASNDAATELFEEIEKVSTPSKTFFSGVGSSRK